MWIRAGSGLLISILERSSWFCLNGLITLVLLMWKWLGFFLRKNRLLGCWGCLYLLIWIGALTLFLLLKLSPRKLEPWFVLYSFFLIRLLFISVNLPHGLAWNSDASTYLKLLDKLQKWICRTVGCSFSASLKPLAHRRDMSSLSLYFYS